MRDDSVSSAEVEEELIKSVRTLFSFHGSAQWDNLLKTLHGIRQVIEYVEENTEYLKRKGIYKIPSFRFVGREVCGLRIFKPINETNKDDDGVPVTVKESGAPLTMHKIKQQEWWKQWMDSKDDGIETTGEPEYRRTIDRMSVHEISEMYKRGMHPCDTCDREIQLRASDLTTQGLAYHIIHVINQSILAGCEECNYQDYKHGRILGGLDIPEEWKERLKKEKLDNEKLQNG